MATIIADAAVRSRHLARTLAVAGATTATLTVWAIAGPLAGIDLAVRLGSGIGHIGPVRVAGATALVGLAGWALLAALERWTSRPRGTWITVALTVLLVSMTGPLIQGVTMTATVALTCMHLACAAVLVPLLARTS
jgi:hypothetical protein